MSLTWLASELILQLPSFLGFQDLLSLSQTCRRHRNVLLSSVYRTIQLRWDIHYSKFTCNPPIHLLVRTLIENPDFGAFVQHIDFQGAKYDCCEKVKHPAWTADMGQAESILQVTRLACQKVSQLELSPQETWQQALSDGDTDAYVALALAMMPNLRILELGWHFAVLNPIFLKSIFIRARSTSPSINPVITAAISSPTLPRFNHLRTVRFGRPPGLPTRTPGVLPVALSEVCAVLTLPRLAEATLQLPTVRKPRATASCTHAELLRVSLLPLSPPKYGQASPFMTNLTSLTLPHCNAPPDILSRILAHKPPLQRLRYYYLCVESIRYDVGYYFDLGVLREALQHIRATLKELVVSFAHEEPCDVDGWECYENGAFTGVFGGLTGDETPMTSSRPEGKDNTLNEKSEFQDSKDFKLLERLEIPLAILIGWSFPSKTSLVSVLPRNITQLCLRADVVNWQYYHWRPVDIMRQVEDVLKARGGGKFPALERIEIVRGSWDQIHRRRSVTRTRRELVQLGTWQGVEIVFSKQWGWWGLDRHVYGRYEEESSESDSGSGSALESGMASSSDSVSDSGTESGSHVGSQAASDADSNAGSARGVQPASR